MAHNEQLLLLFYKNMLQVLVLVFKKMNSVGKSLLNSVRQVIQSRQVNVGGFL